MMREHETVEAGGLGSGGAFSIAASSKAFEILSSNLYQNKTLAVIREITCNAVDAHTMVGAPISAIKVHLPTYANPVFYVRDFGPGLSHDDVLSLYTTYFRSTKDHDNTQIGGFGLGSKSPFAVTDQFTVTSWHEGEKRTYVCYRQDGLPRVNHVSTEGCGTDTGIEVRVPLTRASGGFGDWYEQAGKLFRWWPTKPSCNIDLSPWNFIDATAAFKSEHQVDGGPAWTVREDLQQGTVVMGNVPYRLDFNSLPDLPPPVRKVLSSVWLAIRAPMGSVSISPSREALSYDPATIKYLTLRLAEILRDLKQVVEADVAKQPTLAAARRYIHAHDGIGRGHLMNALKDHIHLTWQGRAINAKESIDLSTIAPAGTTPKLFDYTRHSHWNGFRREPYGDDNATLEHGFPRYKNTRRVVMWVSKVTAATYAKLKHAYPLLTPREDVKLTVVSGVPYQDFCDLCEKRGIPMPVNIDTDLAAPSSTAVAPTSSAPKTRGYVFDPNDYSFDRTTKPLDLAGGGIYLEFVEGSPSANYQQALRSLRTIGFLGVSVNPRVIGLSKAVLDKSKTLQASLALHGWVRFDSDWVAANVPESFIEEHYRAAAVITWLHGGGGLGKARFEKVTWKGFDSMLQIARPYLKRSFDYTKHAAPHDSLDVMMSAGQVKAKERGRNVGYQLAGEWKKFLDMHPMLHYVNFQNFQNIPEAVLNDYINR
jgi:hypothetical protein